jgi:hypothetical protein
MAGFAPLGWRTPDGSDPEDFWKIVRGDAAHGLRCCIMIRAHFTHPAKFRDSVAFDITITRLTAAAVVSAMGPEVEFPSRIRRYE